jgi:hypothetical protein
MLDLLRNTLDLNRMKEKKPITITHFTAFNSKKYNEASDSNEKLRKIALKPIKNQQGRFSSVLSNKIHHDKNFSSLSIKQNSVMKNETERQVVAHPYSN